MKRKNKAKIVIIEDYLLTRTILKKMVEQDRHYEVCADFDNAEDGIEFIKNNNVDLVLIDIGLSGMNGIDASSIIKKILRKVKIILLTSVNNYSEILSGVFANVDAYVLKDIDQKQLKKVIDTVLKGDYWIDSRVQYLIFYYIKSLSDEDYLYLKNVLNSTECLLITLVLKGFKKREVAKFMNLNLSELSLCVYLIFKKISKTQTAKAAIREFGW